MSGSVTTHHNEDKGGWREIRDHDVSLSTGRLLTSTGTYGTVDRTVEFAYYCSSWFEVRE